MLWLTPEKRAWKLIHSLPRSRLATARMARLSTTCPFLMTWVGTRTPLRVASTSMYGVRLLSLIQS